MPKNKLLKIIAGIGFPALVSGIICWAIFIRLPLPCIFRSITGLLCPSCGATRAIISLFYGDLAAAVGYNAFVVFMLIPGAALALYIYFGILFGYLKKISQKCKLSILFIVTAIVFLFFIFGLVRNFYVF